MKKALLSLLILTGLTAFAHSAQDRYGSVRNEIPRSSYTSTADIGVTIASNVPTVGAPMVLRSIVCSGVNATTVTVADATFYTPATSTKAVYIYIPSNPTSILGSPGNQIYYDTYMSSGIKYTKDGGNAPCHITWDFITEPRFPVYRP